MNFNALFFTESILLGVGLAMDAFSVSIANGLNEPNMKKSKFTGIAGVFAFFQFLMPMLGWLCVHTAATYFSAFQKYIPYIALVLLCFIGGKMIYESVKGHKDEVGNEKSVLGFGALIMQGVATSIDALSVGFTIAEYNVYEALVCGLIIAAVTFLLCLGALFIGKRAGTRLADKAGILGGSILIFIGFEIFVTNLI